jgi:hypothetical protein
MGPPDEKAGPAPTGPTHNQNLNTPSLDARRGWDQWAGLTP